MADRNPLRRSTDVLQSRIGAALIALAAAAACVAIPIGVDVHQDMAEKAAQAQATYKLVTAQVLESTTVVLNPSAAARPQTYAAVRWQTDDGTPQQGYSIVPATKEAGEPVEIWLDQDGHPARPPLTATDAVLCGIVAGLGTIAVAWSVLALCWLGIQRLAFAVNSRRWAEEWAAVEPLWRREFR